MLESPTARRAIAAAADTYRSKQCRLHRKRLGIVLEPERLGIRRQHRLRVHIHRDQIAHCVGVFGAIETMQAGRMARVHMSRSRAVNFRFQPSSDFVVGGIVGPRKFRRRHRAASQLCDHLLPGLLRIGRIVRVSSIQREPRGLQLIVVTRDAILVHQFASGIVRGGLAATTLAAKIAKQGSAVKCVVIAPPCTYSGPRRGAPT